MTAVDAVQDGVGVAFGKTCLPPREFAPLLSLQPGRLLTLDLPCVRPSPARKWILPAAIIGLVVMGFSVSTFWDRQAGERWFELASSSSHLRKGLSELEPRLIAHEARGLSGEPVPLGLTLRGTADGGVVIIAGLVPGMTLSSGNALGTDAWQVPARNLDETWIGPPQNFVGVVKLISELHLPGGTIVHRQPINIEWIAASASGLAQVSSPDDQEQVTNLREPTSDKWGVIRHCWSLGQLVGSSPLSTASCR